MRTAALASLAVLALGTALPEAAHAEPGGCLKYGLGGAIAGHFAGGHRWKGAAAGCALGYYQRRRYEDTERQRTRDRDAGRYSRDLDRDRLARGQREDRDRGFARGDRRLYDPDETGTLRRSDPRTEF
jgi:hypothetical protein